MIENGTIRRLPDKTDKIFEHCYLSPSYVFTPTVNCPRTVRDRLVYLFNFEGLSWLKPLQTSTSRKLFLGQLDKDNYSLPNVIFKESRFAHPPPDSASFQPGSAANEIRSNLLLGAVVQKQIKSGELFPPDGFSSLSVSVEQPLGILVDKQHKSKYSVFYFETGFDLGEILQYTDPPMQGAVNYNPQDWKTYCGIKDVLDRIAQGALERGLVMQDYDIHQVLYRADENTKSLQLVLIDSERFRTVNKK
ncbi:MAG: hypothetical protein WD967_00415 [Candidatus Levyibacteriota bacterium]